MDCKYVGSRGLLLSCNRKSSNPIPDSDELDIELYANITENEILHVCPQALPKFVKTVLPRLQKPFLLLTNNSDLTIGEDLKTETDVLLSNPYLRYWFAQNCIVNHEKIIQIPIGLDYHSLLPVQKPKFSWISIKSHDWGERKSTLEQETDLIDLVKHAQPFYERRIKSYANFHFLVGTRYGKVDRIDAYNTLKKDFVYYQNTKVPRIQSWYNMIDFAFVISPHGNGLDCHRTWEALCLGCIPIVKTSGLDPLFKDLPVWIVSGWDEVTYINMIRTIDMFKEKTFDYEKLTLSYWQKLLKTKQDGS